MTDAIMRTYLETVVNVSSATARLITDQNMDDFNELDGFSEDDMRSLCTTLFVVLVVIFLIYVS